MATTTPNYGLTKPDLSELYDIGVQNTNMDLIDSLSASKADLAKINSDFANPAQGSAVAVTSRTSPFTDIASFTLDKGTWLVIATVNFAANASGYRHVIISDTSSVSGANYTTTWLGAPAPSDVTRIQVTTILRSSVTTTYYVEAKQNSGSSLNTSARVMYIKLR